MLCGFRKRCHPPQSHKNCERDGVHVRSHLDQAFFRQEVERHLDDAAANLRKLLFDLLHREAHGGDMAGLDGRLRGIGCGRQYSRASAARTIALRELDSPLYCASKRSGQLSCGTFQSPVDETHLRPRFHLSGRDNMEDGLVDIGYSTQSQSATVSNESVSGTYRSSWRSPAAMPPFVDSTGPVQTAKNVRSFPVELSRSTHHDALVCIRFGHVHMIRADRQHGRGDRFFAPGWAEVRWRETESLLVDLAAECSGEAGYFDLHAPHGMSGRDRKQVKKRASAPVCRPFYSR